MKKTLIVLVLVLGLSVFAGIALGRSDEGLGRALEQLSKKIERLDFSNNDFERGTVPMSMVINGNGHVRLTRATVKSVSGDNIGVEVWKLNFIIHKMSDTQVFAPGKEGMNWGDIKVNDVLDVTGNVDANTSALIHAKIVHDRSVLDQARETEIARLRERINELIKRLNEILGKIGATPIPTVSPTPSPSPSPTPSPTPTPTPSPTPTPTP